MSIDKTVPTVVDESVGIANDDYALARVPQEARYSWVSVAMQRLGQLSALAQFFLAASIGIGMKFWDAMLAILLGSVILEIVTIFTGIAGVKEGLSTSVLARWTGFGLFGSALVGLAFTVSLTGWFAFQNEIFGMGLNSIFPSIPLAVWCILGGLVVTLIVVNGFASMNWVAWVTVPAFVLLCLYSVGTELQKHSLGELMASAPPGKPISLATAATFVAGGFIVGAIFTPDMSRFNRTPADVVKQTLVGVTVGEFFVGVIGVLLAHAVKGVAENAGLVIGIIQSTSGTLGVLILVVSIVKINDWNLYPSSLGLTNALHGLFGIKLNRAWVAAVLGVIGSVISAMGISNNFTNFLGELGIFFPPIAAIMIADYFVLKTWRTELSESHERMALPAMVPTVVPAGLIAWALGYGFGKFSSMNPEFLAAINVPAITSLVFTFVIYIILGKLGLARGIGMKETRSVDGAA